MTAVNTKLITLFVNTHLKKCLLWRNMRCLTMFVDIKNIKESQQQQWGKNFLLSRDVEKSMQELNAKNVQCR